jgi:hypothetical protein
MRAAPRLLALALLITATGAGAIVDAATAQGAACGPEPGVTVVVDPGSPETTSVGCATGDPATGLDALNRSGHRYTFVPRQPGFLCTVDARPDPCNDAPANAYWSYWHAQPGGSWSYGSTGAGSYHPKAGSIDGWSFGDGRPPSLRPSSAQASGATSGTGTATGVGTAGTAAALGAKAQGSVTVAPASDGRGGLGGLVLGVGLVVVLGGAAVVVARRRQQPGS